MNRQEKILKIYNKKDLVNGFDYDLLMHYPLNYYFSYNDYQEINYISTSPKLTGKPVMKNKMLDECMKRKGLTRLGAGTNRIVYKSEYDPSVVFKIGIDSIGLSDNIAEYNETQHLLKPFCAKPFDIGPNGVIGMFERVDGIQNRYQFAEIAQQVFDIINIKFPNIVMEDIGCNFFMNWGIRQGFGPVLLDYPYAYILDGDKLNCNRRNKFTNMMCNGTIDYDNGLNSLVCEKCGSRYSARELSKINKNVKTYSQMVKKELEEMAEIFVVSTTIHGKKSKGVTIGGIPNSTTYMNSDMSKAKKVINNTKPVVVNKKEEQKVEINKEMPKPKVNIPIVLPPDIKTIDPDKINPQAKLKDDILIDESMNTPLMTPKPLSEFKSKGELQLSTKAEMKKDQIMEDLNTISCEWFDEFIKRDVEETRKFNMDNANELIEFCIPKVTEKYQIDAKSARSIVTDYVYVNCDIDDDEEEKDPEPSNYYDKYSYYDTDESNIQKIKSSTKFKDF